MSDLLRRIRGAIGMGLSWAVGWGLVVILLGLATILLPGSGFEIIFEAADDELLPLVLVSAFAGGVTFSGVLALAGRRRRFDELSLGRFAGWGALGGFLLTMIPGIGAAVEQTATVTQAALIVGGATLLGAVSAAGSLVLARRSEDRALLETGNEVAAVGLSADEARTLLGGE